MPRTLQCLPSPIISIHHPAQNWNAALRPHFHNHFTQIPAEAVDPFCSPAASGNDNAVVSNSWKSGAVAGCGCGFWIAVVIVSHFNEDKIARLNAR